MNISRSLINKPKWEQGSEFHYITSYQSNSNFFGEFQIHRTFGSGRDAIRTLLLHGQKELNWKRLFLPSYFCHDVVESIISTSIEIQIYHDNPIADTFDELTFKKGDVILVVNYFGLRAQKTYEKFNRDLVTIIEDHTHNPISDWALNSIADWCLASLRKVFPVPDGGILWSPKNLSLPKHYSLSDIHYTASLEKFSAMLMKTMYLNSFAVNKNEFRHLALKGEKKLVDHEISDISPFSKKILLDFNYKEWLVKKKDNFYFLVNLLKDCNWFRCLYPYSENIIPFSIILLFESSEYRKKTYQILIENNIYPAILWDLSNSHFPLFEDDKDFSERIISIHCDARYDLSDLQRIYEVISFIGKQIFN